MPPLHLDPLLKNYDDLVLKVDAHTQRVSRVLGSHITCKKGCDACCRPLELFAVEAFALARAFGRLAQSEQDILLSAVARSRPGQCPLLVDRACALYAARPVICRTHGFPLYIEKDGEVLVDFCPENFKSLASFPKDCLLSLEPLNTLLVAVNRHFLSTLPEIPDSLGDRVPIKEALGLLKG